jgi:hypothetical protein
LPESTEIERLKKLAGINLNSTVMLGNGIRMR